MTAATSYQAIPRIPAPSVEDFARDILRKPRPAIIEGATDTWNDPSSWTVERLLDTVGDNIVAVMRAPNAIYELHPKEGGPRYGTEAMPFREFVDRITNGGDPQWRYYLQRAQLALSLPQLLPRIEMPPYVEPGKVYMINFWMGPSDSVSKVHYDVPNNFLVQLHGRKRFLIFPPGETANLYPYSALRTRSYNGSPLDVEDPDLDRFPRFARARGHACVLEPGDMLFMPSYWWHQVRNLDLGMMINFWWFPRPRQLLGRQTIVNIPGISSELWRLARERAGARTNRARNDS